MSGEMDTVLQNFRQHNEQMRRQKTRRAVENILRAVGDKSDTMVSVATGKLLQSRFMTITDTFFGMKGVVGYNAPYAVFVHQAAGVHLGKGTPRSPASLGNLWDVTGEPQFLFKGAKAVNQAGINSLIRNSYA